MNAKRPQLESSLPDSLLRAGAEPFRLDCLKCLPVVTAQRGGCHQAAGQRGTLTDLFGCHPELASPASQNSLRLTATVCFANDPQLAAAGIDYTLRYRNSSSSCPTVISPMSSTPTQSSAEDTRPRGQSSLILLLLYAFVLLGGTAPSAQGQIPGKPHLTLKLERFVAAGAKGDLFASVARNDEYGDKPDDSDDPSWPPLSGNSASATPFSSYARPALAPLPRLASRYAPQVPRAPPLL